MGHPIHKHMNSGMSRKASPLNDFKGGYHKVEHAKGEAHKSPASNMQHDSMGDKAKHQHMMKEHPAKPPTSRYSSPANNITYGDKSGPTGYIGEQRADDMKYNPVDDRAGMSRYKSDDKGSPAKQNYNEVNVQDLQDMGKVKKNKKGKYVVNENAKTAKDTLYIPKKTKSYTGKKIKVGQMIDESDYENLSKKANNPVSRNKYGGNKGDERRSAKKDYDGMSRYGGNKGDIKRSAKKDY